jgi:hypothetical protein
MDPKYKSFVLTIVFMFFVLAVAVATTMVAPIGKLAITLLSWVLYLSSLLLVIRTGIRSQGRQRVKPMNSTDLWTSFGMVLMTLTISVIATSMIPDYYSLLSGVINRWGVLLLKVGYITTVLASWHLFAASLLYVAYTWINQR